MEKNARLSTATTMREENMRIVYGLIRDKGKITKPEICDLTGLSAPTIKNIMEQLNEADMIKSEGKIAGSSNGGPCPELYSINETRTYMIGIDVNTRGIKGVLCDLKCSVIAEKDKYDCYGSREQFTNTLYELIDLMISDAKIDKNMISAINISVAALVDYAKKSVNRSRIKVLRDYSFIDSLSTRYQAKIHLENDINTIALANSLAYNGERAQNLICVGIRSGLGLGIIINGRVYRGFSGKSGSLEASGICGEREILTRVREYVSENSDKFPQFDASELTMQIVYKELMNNEDIKKIFNEAYISIGKKVGELTALFDPEYFFLAGQMFEYDECAYEIIVKTAIESLEYLAPLTTKYRVSKLPSDSVALLAVSNRLKIFYI